ncbi:Methyltransferase domain-containing protein [Magnetospirillum fulvum]|uniref:Methyltransferase domain-containing protein n=2 Tax=Magnetospirillum fulvum TaxID=1082 RepID=A0A1H6HD79_MAGFU|nr:Methyltransferase domain-containing protein [Magnetospirillum fulvum]
MPVEFFSANCPACGHHVAVPFFDGGQHPLATLAWPSTANAARTLPRLPLDFVMCVECGHVFNRSFDYAAVPYSEKPNLMFNRGVAWSGFLQGVRDTILSGLSAHPVVVEIGHGDGSFLAALAGERAAGRYIGFDPNGAASGHGNVEFRSELFDPARHLAELRPELIISRHVLEHLVNPVGFIQGISFAASMQGLVPRMYMEVPCIDAAIAGGRSVDFYYEHGSQFTTTSFQRMLTRATAKILEIGHGYGGEVVFGFAELGAPGHTVAQARVAASFRDAARASVTTIVGQLAALHSAGSRVAIWGGTGKSAAFMSRFCVDSERFPLVVDSDPAKVGTFVPGTGQEIRFRDWLRHHPVDVVIIPPQWRAADIVAEMAANGLTAGQVLIEHCGRLIDFAQDDHPYRRS